MAGGHLVLAALAFGSGCLVGPEAPPGAAAWMALAGSLAAGALGSGAVEAARSPALLASAGLLTRTARDQRERILEAAGVSLQPPPTLPAHRVALLSAALILTGCGWAGIRSTVPPGVELLRGTVSLTASVAADPRSSEFGWSAEAIVRTIAAERGRFAVRLRVLLSGSGSGSRSSPHLEPGDVIAARGSGDELSAGGFGDYLRSRGVVAEVRVRDVSKLRAATGPLALANATRRALRRGAERSLPPREAGLLLGLAIGDTRTLDTEVEEDFRATGMTHLLAVSGSNVAMILAPMLALAIAAGARLRGRLMVGLATVAFFALVTRWEPSVLRASAMAGLALVALTSGRPRATATLMSAAALILLVADPGLARSVGFQLSVAATAGIAGLAGPIADRLDRLPRALALAAGVTAGAQLGVTPLLVLRFGEVPVATLAANLVAAPLVPLALAGGLGAAGLGLLAPGLGGLMAPVLAAPTAALVAVADGFAKLGLPWISGGPGLALALGTSVLVVARALRARGGRSLGRSLSVLAGTCLLLAGARAGPPDSLTVTFFDVGQGDSAVVRTPEGVTVLIDAGPDEREVSSLLARLGVRRLDLVIASHAHADHIEGFPAVFARYRTGLILEPRCEADSPAYSRFLRAAAAERISVRAARGGQRIRLGGLRVEVLGPDRCSSEGPNDDSVVVRIRYGRASILFPGDAEVSAQRDLLRDGDPVRATVLKLPHHGGDTSLPEFAAATRARIAIVSVGAGNDYGHPAPEALAALRAASIRILRTDRVGEITVTFSGADPVVRSGR